MEIRSRKETRSLRTDRVSVESESWGFCIEKVVWTKLKTCERRNREKSDLL